MSLLLRGKTWWIDITDPKTGARHRISTKTGDRKLAEVQHGEAHKALLLGQQVGREVGKAYTLGDAIDRALRLDLRGLKSAVTLSQHLDRITHAIPRGTPLAAIGSTHVDKLVAELEQRGNGPVTINRVFQTLGRVLRLAQGYGMLDKVIKLPRLKEPVVRIRTYTDAEVVQMVDYFRGVSDDAMVHLCYTLLDTGMRLGELIKWHQQEIHGSAVRLWDTKTASRSVVGRTVPLTARALASLTWLRQHKPWTTKDQIEWRFASMKRMVFPEDPTIHIHAFRHSCCTRLIQRGMPLVHVMQWMGHQDWKTTLRYTHMTPGDLTQGVALLEAPGCDVGCDAGCAEVVPQDDTVASRNPFDDSLKVN